MIQKLTDIWLAVSPKGRRRLQDGTLATPWDRIWHKLKSGISQPGQMDKEKSTLPPHGRGQVTREGGRAPAAWLSLVQAGGGAVSFRA
jgi:hypothetical protein